MKQYLIMAAVAATAAFAVPTAAMARPGFVTTSLNLRAGPSTSFPVVDTLPAGASVNIHGCLAGYTWCDVGWRGERGWVAGRYLDFVYRGRRVLLPDYAVEVGFPIVGFSVGTYWNHYYRHRSFYHRRHNFERRYRPSYFPRREHREYPRRHGRSSVLVSPPQGNNFGVRHRGRPGGGHHMRPGVVTGQPYRGGGHVSRPGPGNAGVHMGGGRRGSGGGGNPQVRGGGGHPVGTPPMGGRGSAGGGGRGGGGGGGGVVHDY
jgi:uncharacterized protein YraI